MATNTSGGTTSSFNNTPQAKDDYQTAWEDDVFAFDVMANDLGGAAKILWSIDDTNQTDDSGNGSIDLLTRDGTPTSIPEYSDLGARIWIENGIVKYDSNPIDSLAAGQQTIDRFTYAIRLANGTLSWATVYVTLTGSNDAVSVTSATASGTVVEDSALTPSLADSNVASGTIAFTDVDLSDTHSASFGADPSNTTALGAFALGSVSEAANAASGSVGWSYTIDEAAAQYLADGQSVTEKYVVTLSDGHGSTATQTVTVTISGSNDVVSVTSASATGTVVEDSATTPSAADSNVASGMIAFIDVDLSDAHSASFVADPTNSTALGAFVLGSVSEAANAASGSVGWTYTIDEAAAQHLAEGQSATEKYVVTLSDGHGSTTTQVITVTITGTNDAPLVSGTVAGTATEDGLGSTLDALANASDIDDGTTLSVTGIPASLPAGVTYNAATHGFTLDPANGAYQHLATGQTATVSVSYGVSDGIATTPASVSWTITGTNDAPVLTGTAAVLAAGTEDIAYTVTKAQLLQGWTDADDGATLNVSGLSASVGTVIDNGNGTFTITQAPDFNGPVTLNYNVGDGTASSAASLGYTIGAVNDAPVNNMPTSFVTPEDTHLVLSGLSVSDVDAGSGNVTVTLSVDSGAILMGSSISVISSGSGTNTVTVTGTVAAVNAFLANPGVQPEFWPPDNPNGPVTLTMTTSDLGHNGGGGAQVDVDTRTITVTPVNDGPYVANEIPAQFFDEDTPVLFQVPANTFVDPEGDALTYTATMSDGSALPSWLTFDASTKTFSGTPPQDYYDDLGLMVTASDGSVQTFEVFGLSILAVNDAPVNILPSTFTTANDAVLKLGGLAVQDVDSGADDITVKLTVAAGTLTALGTAHVTVTGSGTGVITLTGQKFWINDYLATAATQPTYTPVAGSSGTVTLTMVSDDHGAYGSGGAQTDTDTSTINVTAVNAAPVNTVPVASQSATAGSALSIGGVSVSDDNTNLTTTLSVAHGTLSVTSLAGLTITGNGTGSVTLSGDKSLINSALTGLSYTASGSYSGSDTLTVNTSDGSLNDSDNVAINVAAANGAPTAKNDSWVLSDTTALPAGTITPEWFLNNDSDPENGPLYVINVAGLPAGLTANYDGAGHLVSITGTTPAAGSFSLTYTMTDGTTSKTATVSVAVLDTTSSPDTFTLEGNDYSYVDLLSGGDTITGDANLGGPVINGNAGKDVFVGNNGADTLNGGAGDDQLFGNENDDTLNGDAGNDLLNGGNNNDRLNGGVGNDSLIGGTANDIFIFNTGLDASTNVDKVLDFDASSADKIHLDDAIFAGIANAGGSLSATDFVANEGGIATTATQNILYDTNTGNLYYDPDGNGAAAKILFATLTVVGGTVDASDFIVI
jgi:VCBS repeat-containing protein